MASLYPNMKRIIVLLAAEGRNAPSITSSLKESEWLKRICTEKCVSSTINGLSLWKSYLPNSEADPNALILLKAELWALGSGLPPIAKVKGSFVSRAYKGLLKPGNNIKGFSQTGQRCKGTFLPLHLSKGPYPKKGLFFICPPMRNLLSTQCTLM